MSATPVRESMQFPTRHEWDELVPIERFQCAAGLVVEARMRRSPTSDKFLTANETQAMNTLVEALKDLGYEFRADVDWQIRRTA